VATQELAIYARRRLLRGAVSRRLPFCCRCSHVAGARASGAEDSMAWPQRPSKRHVRRNVIFTLASNRASSGVARARRALRPPSYRDTHRAADRRQAATGLTKKSKSRSTIRVSSLRMKRVGETAATRPAPRLGSVTRHLLCSSTRAAVQMPLEKLIGLDTPAP